jgi:chromosome partitioning protein
VKSSFDVLIGEETLSGAAIPTDVPRVSIVPATMDLLGAELTLASQKDRTQRLKMAVDALAAAPENARFSYILIDCPPSLNLLTINALAASDGVLVPLQCEFFALEGLSQLLKTVEQVRVSVNANLEIYGVVLTMFDPRNNLANQVIRDARQFLGSKVFETVIPRNVRVSEAPSFGKPALLYDLKCAGSQAYLKLASEVIQRERLLQAAE